MTKKPNIKYLLLFIIFFLILFYIYFYVINEKFTNPETTLSGTSTTTTQSITISTQLQNQIALLIGIAPSRILNLTYTGDLSKNQLTVSFDFLEASATDKLREQLTKKEAFDKAIDLFDSNNFIVPINGSNITLNKSKDFNKLIINDKSRYFDNKGMIDISNYARNVYKGNVPQDKELTNYYKLSINKNFNVVPTI